MRNLESLRQTPSVEHGIAQRHEDEGVTLVVYEPGNMTRYVIALSAIPDTACKVLGANPGAMLVSHTNRSTCYTFQPKGLLHYAYVGAKLNIPEPDSVVIAELIGYLMGRPAVSCEEYTVAFHRREKEEAEARSRRKQSATERS